ncbi:MAG: F0F1 ATP synthase subunit A [Armatimonadetes bacterium]|nr:F0F1 ATP synthase subunit A [Armatimonadota bacterium]
MPDSGALIAAAEHAEGAWWAPIVYTVLVCLVIIVAGRIGLLGAKEHVPRNMITRLFEHLYLFIENMCLSVIGPHGQRYIPLVFTIYMIVLLSNFFGLIGLTAPTSSFGVTFGMAVMVVVYVQWEGIRTRGPVGYVRHFFGPPLGEGLPLLGRAFMLLITLLLFVIEVISEIAKNLSLSLRLYGNMSGEHEVGVTFGGLVKFADLWAPLGAVFGDMSVPLHALLFPLAVFVSVVQALIFTILTCVYLSLLVRPPGEAAHAH